MKHIYIYLLTISTFSYSQSINLPLRPISIPSGVSNYYLKDTYNDFNQYIGTWRFDSLQTNISLLIKFRKIEKYHDLEDNIFHDFLAGEYQYIENGIEIINTLPLLNLPITSNPYNNNILGYSISKGKYGFPTCLECPDDVIRIKLSFDDPERMFNSGGMHMWHKTEADGTEKIMIDLYYDGLGLRFWEHPNEPTTLRVPYGKYTLTKVLE